MLLHDPGADLLGPDVTHVVRALRQLSAPAPTAELAAAASLSPARTRAALNGLVGIGLVIKSDAGRAHSYSVNPSHVAWDGIQLLLDARLVVLRQARMICGIAPPDVSIALCAPSSAPGSASERKVRFVIVVPDPLPIGPNIINSITNELERVIGRMTGSEIAIEIVAEPELRDRLGNDDDAVNQWFRSTTVHGPDLSRLMIDLNRDRLEPEEDPAV
ncbi:hypothetical protein ASF62_12035 [Leifsonia sp. Leaf325]|nr:hypothetical protein [Leifsonia sp. Leaf325]KQQ92573.1 hypothetical protein ASF62_12035 [Leifsonia sp. Leaf325]